MGTLIRAGMLYPVATPPVENGWLLVREGKIECVGEGAPPRAYETIDLANHLVMPGFVNAHCHLQFTAARRKKMPRHDFIEWVRAAIAYSSEIPIDEMLRGVDEGTAELLASGTTAVGDIAGHPAVAEKLAGSDLRAVVFAEAIAPDEKNGQVAWSRCLDLLKIVKKTGARAGLSPHGPHTVVPSVFMALYRYARENGLPVTSHVAESPEENRFIEAGEGPFRSLMEGRAGLANGFNGYGKSPVMLIQQHGALRGLMAVHLNELNDEDFSTLVAEKAIPVFCPGSSKWFGRKKVMPFDRFLGAGLAPCIGTDSAASNGSLSMLDELRAAREYFPKVPPEKLVEAATINGARALGLESGALIPGLWADIAAFPLSGKAPLDAVFTAREAAFVMVGGKALRNTA